MESSVIRVFSIISNIRNSLKKNKEIVLDKLVFFKILEKSPEFLKKQYKRIYNEIENSFYTYDDLKLFCFHQIIVNKNVKEVDISIKNIENIKKEFTEQNIEFNKRILIAIEEKIKFRILKKYFEIGNDGYSMVYKLIMKKYISLYFWLLYDKFFVESSLENNKHLKFRMNSNLFKKQIKLFERSLYV